MNCEQLPQIKSRKSKVKSDCKCKEEDVNRNINCWMQYY